VGQLGASHNPRLTFQIPLYNTATPKKIIRYEVDTAPKSGHNKANGKQHRYPSKKG